MKDLLVYLDHTSATEARLEVTFALAKQHQAHVTALCLVAEPFMRGAVGHHMPAGLMREHLAHAEAEADAVLETARTTADRQGVELEVGRETGSLDRLPTMLAYHARHADLTIVGQPNLEVGGVDDTLLVEAAFMDSGRPALVVPYTGTPSFPPRRVLIAWDGTRETARAVHDALPLLAFAEQVSILFTDGRDVGRHGVQAGTDIVRHLGHHGIRAEVSHAQSGGKATSRSILAQAQETGTDLLVMGGYGHSRLREMMLGGATKYMIEHMTVPVMFSH